METKELLKQTYDKGLNVYQLLNRLKKESKVGAVLPDQVLAKVCQSFLKEARPIRSKWAWFVRAVVKSWHEYNAAQNISANKKDTNVKLLREIFKADKDQDTEFSLLHTINPKEGEC